MRPRISKFGKITRKELEKYLNDNQVYGFTVKVDGDILVYSYYMMFRNTKKEPENLYIKVSRNSKLVLSAWLENGREFNSVDELKKYTKR